jgi:hypothetical protein
MCTFDEKGRLESRLRVGYHYSWASLHGQSPGANVGHDFFIFSPLF